MSVALNPVSQTAQIIAAKRAIDSELPNPLLHDPYARLLSGGECDRLLEKWQRVAVGQGLSLQEVITKRTRYVVVRTLFFDQFLKASDSRQIVVLGAGLDTRPFRLQWPAQVNVYEIDCPEVLDFKSDRLQIHQPNCRLHWIGADLSDIHTWTTKLFEAGFTPNMPTIWLAEGVLMYLESTTIHNLMQQITHLSAGGSTLGFDAVSQKSIEASAIARSKNKGRVVRHWQWGTDNPTDFLRRYGWFADQVILPQDYMHGLQRYGNKIPVGASNDVVEHHEGRCIRMIRASLDRDGVMNE